MSTSVSRGEIRRQPSLSAGRSARKTIQERPNLTLNSRPATSLGHTTGWNATHESSASRESWRKAVQERMSRYYENMRNCEEVTGDQATRIRRTVQTVRMITNQLRNDLKRRHRERRKSSVEKSRSASAHAVSLTWRGKIQSKHLTGNSSKRNHSQQGEKVSSNPPLLPTFTCA